MQASFSIPSKRCPSTWRRRIVLCRSFATSQKTPVNLIEIRDGTFYHEHPSAAGSNTTTNPPYFKNLTFSLPTTSKSASDSAKRTTQHWAVIGASDITNFLDVLRGKLLCIPPKSRNYPRLSSDEIARRDPQLSLPSRAIQYVGFNTKSGGGVGSSAGGLQGAYLSARYESRREETDWTVLQYLKGDTELNPSEELRHIIKDEDPLLRQVVRNLRLEKLLSMPVSNLSNGQTRRCRIAKALLLEPELLLLDEPFMGLDPPTLVTLSPMLKDLAFKSSPLLLFGLRPQDAIPDWISHLIILGFKRDVSLMGSKEEVLFQLARWDDLNKRGGEDMGTGLWLRMMEDAHGQPLSGVGDTLTEKGIQTYDTYNLAKEQEKKYFDGVFIRPRVLAWERQKLFEAAEQKPIEQRTKEDWITLLASLPADFEVDAKSAIAVSQNSAQVLGKTSAKKVTHSVTNLVSQDQRQLGEPLIELSNLVLKYGDKIVLGHSPPQPGFESPGLNLTIRRGTRLALLGPNGSGKTTLLSLLTSDHPQSYSLPMKFFGRSRLPSKGVLGLSLWEIQSRIGHSAPEVHAFFPKHLTIRRVLESSWAETYSSKPVMNPERNDLVDRFLRFWSDELCPSSPSYGNDQKPATMSGCVQITEDNDVSWAESKSNSFSTLSFGTQRLLLLLRAIIKQPDIIVLDEAFSGLSSSVRDKAMLFLEHGEDMQSSRPTQRQVSVSKFTGLTPQQAMIVVSHLREEIPYSINEWMRLPSEEEATELDRGVETGFIEPTVATSTTTSEGKASSTVDNNKGIRSVEGWNAVWRL